MVSRCKQPVNTLHSQMSAQKTICTPARQCAKSAMQHMAQELASGDLASVLHTWRSWLHSASCLMLNSGHFSALHHVGCTTYICVLCPETFTQTNLRDLLEMVCLQAQLDFFYGELYILSTKCILWPRTALNDLFHSHSKFLSHCPLVSPKDRKCKLID